jgi:HAD superfamily hydrolase (TIGR01509 family)
MREFFGWTRPESELYAMRHRHFLEAITKADEGVRRSIELMPGVERVVRELHALGVTLAITTSAAGDAVDLLLRRFGIRDLFALIVDGNEVRAGKPDPEGYLLTARKLGVAPSECVVFEDSHVGVLAAKAAGMYCVAVRNPRARLTRCSSRSESSIRSMSPRSVRAEIGDQASEAAAFFVGRLVRLPQHADFVIVFECGDREPIVRLIR